MTNEPLWPPHRMWFGGDYNPEQWPREVWADDLRLMREAGVTVVTVGVFSWARLEPREGEFDFAWLDDVLDGLHSAGIGVDLATATASPPPWMALHHPDILPVTRDGVRLSPGSRQHYSPSSATYRRFAERLVRAMVERYAKHPAIVAWHINNEYGCHVSHSYDDESAAAFRSWLELKYGDIDTLNDAWGTAFWSQWYGSFDEILPPRAAPTFGNPGHLLDFDRFSSDALRELFRAEAAILRAATPEIPITTNFMGFFKGVDYWSWADDVDFVSDDSYPDPADPFSPIFAAASRDLMRSLGGGAPWVLMEQAPSAVNWRERNAPKPAGMNRLHSLQAVARGADGVMYFQWRQSRAGAEKFHSGMVPHFGEHSRIFRETAAIGAQLGGLDDLIGSTLHADVAIVFDWDAWRLLEQQAVPTALNYREIVLGWYRSLWERGILVDFVHPHGDLSRYSVVIAPAMVVADTQTQEALEAFVDGGGRLVMTASSAIVDEKAHIHLGGYLGELRNTLGLGIEEIAPLAGPDLAATGQAPVPATAITGEITGEARLWREFVHPSTATVLSTFDDPIVGGWPAITVNHRGDGRAWYVATMLGEEATDALVDLVLADAGIPTTRERGSTIEVVRRGNRVFRLDHATGEAAIEIVDEVGDDTA
ncbi:beta-galactosidase [Marisediminicola senii]|uniref:beta-galactosidase n=1 Tax=Marisediminicola senii TaxID=2711233 RepID=UPI0013EA35CE|nr:beta-galactosidase [Marisediminicola senii]